MILVFPLHNSISRKSLLESTMLGLCGWPSLELAKNVLVLAGILIRSERSLHSISV